VGHAVIAKHVKIPRIEVIVVADLDGVAHRSRETAEEGVEIVEEGPRLGIARL
jgi:hypothetical protein